MFLVELQMTPPPAIADQRVQELASRAIAGECDKVEELLQHKVDANAKIGGAPLLIFVCQSATPNSKGRLGCIDLLVHHGADLAARSGKERSNVLHHCHHDSALTAHLLTLIQSRGHTGPQVLKMMLNEPTRDEWSSTPLHAACYAAASAPGHCESARLMLETNAFIDIEMKNKKGCSPLACACWAPSLIAARLLIENHRANVNSENNAKLKKDRMRVLDILDDGLVVAHHPDTTELRTLLEAHGAIALNASEDSSSIDDSSSSSSSSSSDDDDDDDSSSSTAPKKKTVAKKSKKAPGKSAAATKKKPTPKPKAKGKKQK